MNPDLLNWERDPHMQAPERELSRQVNIYRKKHFGDLGMTRESIAALEAKIRRQQIDQQIAWDQRATSGQHNLTTIDVPAVQDQTTGRVYDPRTTFYRTMRPGGHAVGPYGQHALSAFGTSGDVTREPKPSFTWFGGQGHPEYPSPYGKWNQWAVDHRNPAAEPHDPLRATQRPTLAMQQAADPPRHVSVSDTDRHLASSTPPGRPGGGTGREWIASIPNPTRDASHAGARLPQAVIEGWKEAVTGVLPSGNLSGLTRPFATNRPPTDATNFADYIDEPFRTAHSTPELIELVKGMGGTVHEDGRVEWPDNMKEQVERIIKNKYEDFNDQGVWAQHDSKKPMEKVRLIEQRIAGYFEGQAWVDRKRAPGAAGVSTEGFPPGFFDDLHPDVVESILGGQRGGTSQKAIEELKQFKRTRSYLRQLGESGWTTDTRGIPEEQLRILAELPVVVTSSEALQSPQMRLPDGTVTLTHPGTGKMLWVTPGAEIFKLAPSGRFYYRVFGEGTSALSIEEGSGMGTETIREQMARGRKRTARGRKPSGSNPHRPGSAEALRYEAKQQQQRGGKGRGRKGRGGGAAGAAGTAVIAAPIIKDFIHRIQRQRRMRNLSVNQ
jgi:hypothetical protein